MWITVLSLAREGSIANDRMYQPTTTLNNKGFWTFDLLQAVLAYNMQIFGLFGLCLLSLYICLSSFYSNDSMHKFHRYILELWQIKYPKSVVRVNSKLSINQIEPKKAPSVPQISQKWGFKATRVYLTIFQRVSNRLWLRCSCSTFKNIHKYYLFQPV